MCGYIEGCKSETLYWYLDWYVYRMMDVRLAKWQMTDVLKVVEAVRSFVYVLVDGLL